MYNCTAIFMDGLYKYDSVVCFYGQANVKFDSASSYLFIIIFLDFENTVVQSVH